MNRVRCAAAGNPCCVVGGKCTLGLKLVDVLLELYWKVVLPCWPE
jgi:hypothetical protein